MLEIAVITISDRAFSGEYQDLSGPKIAEIIQQSDLDANISINIVPDDKEKIREMIENHTGKDFIITTGGTGLSKRDITPEVTRQICDREIPGIAEMIRFESYKETRNAVLSRGYSGLKGNTIIINLPGSVKAVAFCTKLILPIMEHAVTMLQGKGH